jgi:hypothetical protein
LCYIETKPEKLTTDTEYGTLKENANDIESMWGCIETGYDYGAANITGREQKKCGREPENGGPNIGTLSEKARDAAILNENTICRPKSMDRSF